MNKEIPANNFFRRVKSLKRYSTGIVSLLCTTAFFALYLSVFRMSYLVNDDITMISLVSGYWGGKPVPFMVYSNVIWGFLLMWLYAIHSNLNWEIWLFLLINFLSVFALVYIALSRPFHFTYRIAAVLAILTCDGFFLINITYTEIATFALLAGSCLILMTSYSQMPLKSHFFIYGGVLIVVGSLLRVDALYLVWLAILPSALILYRVFDRRRITLTLVVTSLVVIGCYAFNKIYVGAHSDWNSYYVYNHARSMIQDTPRAHAENIGDVLPEVGWSGNDYRLFLNWYFPDPNVYSLSNLEYLVNHVSDSETSVSDAYLAYFRYHHIFNSVDTFPYLWITAAIWFLALIYQPLRKAIPSLAALLASSSMLILYLVWKENVPLHVWYSFLSATVIFSLCILSWNTDRAAPVIGSGKRSAFPFLPASVFLLTALFAFSFVLHQAIIQTKVNIAKQSTYLQVLTDLDTLQAQGKIASNALIISPAVGIPIEWSNPLALNLPRVQYMQMEWLTFSPAYETVLHVCGVDSLPVGFYQTQNIYLSTKSSLIPSIVQSIKDNEKVNVRAEMIASPSNDLTLYQLIEQK